jgi:hypothetical protein
MKFLSQHCDTKTKGFIEPKGSRGGFEGGGGMNIRVGFININNMYNNNGCQGGVRGYEAYEVK